MPPLMQLPSYQINNALVDFRPLNEGIDAYQKGQENVRRFNVAQSAGNALMNKDYSGAMATALQGDRPDLAGLAMQAQAHASQQEDASFNRTMRMAQVHGAMADRVLKGNDPSQQQAAWQQMLGSHPEYEANLQKFGVDPRDYKNGLAFVRDQAASHLAELELKKAQAHAAYRGDEPEIVRQLRAAGVDPKSAQGREMIMNAIKGGSPLDQAVAAAIKGQQGAPAAAQQPQGGVVPQSYTPPVNDQGGIVPVQTVPQPAAAPSEPMVDTPLGPMAKSRAAAIGLGFAANGKGDAAKMFADPDKFGKEAQNKLDEKMVNTGEQIARLESIANSIKPELLSVEGRVKGGWLALQDSLRSGNKNMSPQDRQYLVDFTTLRAKSIANLNNYIKEMTGAAMSEAEAKRLTSVMPNAGTGVFDGDSPTQFKTKMDVVVREAKMAMARAQFAKANNRPWNSIPLDQMPAIIQQRGDQILKDIQAQAPNAPVEQLKPFVKQKLNQEFGI